MRYSPLKFLLAGFVSFYGCFLATPVERIEVERLTNRYFPAKTEASEVRILLERPKEYFISIARLRGQGNPGSSMTVLLEELREKAAALGADAILPLKGGSKISPRNSFSCELRQDYGLPPSLNESHLAISATKPIPWAVALAIKFP